MHSVIFLCVNDEMPHIEPPPVPIEKEPGRVFYAYCVVNRLIKASEKSPVETRKIWHYLKRDGTVTQRLDERFLTSNYDKLFELAKKHEERYGGVCFRKTVLDRMFRLDHFKKPDGFVEEDYRIFMELIE